jgi:protein-S-isoprenylcysteine O-methyltransferase Ste14
MHWLDYIIIGTYISQAFQIFFYSVPSAGSTCEILFNLKKKSMVANRHPGARIIQSKPKIVVTAAVTLAVLVASMIPILTLLFPELNPYLLPLIKSPSPSLSIISACLLISGNSLTYIAVATLKAHVRFHEFGETARLHTAGIYGYIRNPITLGLAAIFAGFVLARLSVAMLLGLIIFLLNAGYRIKMEEVYLEKTFSHDYLQYKNNVGKYFPKIHRGVKSLISKNS